VAGGLVILNIGGANGPSVVAFDVATGRLAWGAERQWGAGYASPVPATLHGRRVVFVFAGGESDPPTGGLICLDPRTGTTHFRFPWRSGRIASVNASSPVVAGETVFLSSIYDIGGALLRVGPKLTYTVVYRTKDYAAHWMTPIVRGGCLYGFADAKLVCMDLKTGREIWSTKPTWLRPPDADGHRRKEGLGRASLLWADGAFLCLGEFGDLCWMDLSPKGMRITARAKLFHARQTWVCPVLSRGLLYVCQNEPDRRSGQPPRLLCYGLRGGR
jgi:outer membrane protein assembly factor BamB